MPKIYGGSPRAGSLREEEIAEASFRFSGKWAASKHASLTVGALQVAVRREVRGWVGVIFDLDNRDASVGREIWRDKNMWIDEMRALDEAAAYARTVCPVWTQDEEYGFHTLRTEAESL